MQRPIEELITDDARAMMRREIEGADGNEVFFVGATDEAGRVATVKAFARGNRSCVAAVRQSAEPGNVVIHNHPGGDLTPSDADVELSGVFSSLGIGSYIVDNEVTHVYLMVEPYGPKKRVVVDAAAVRAFFAHDGVLARKFDAYEFRPEQLAMAEEVRRACAEERIAFIEAGTGTGKTFAYLVPALLSAVANKDRVVISTNTINLQEQLMLKDIPFLKKTLAVNFEAVLVKGRSNYVCLRRLHEEHEHGDLFDGGEHRDRMRELFDWAQQTDDGSLRDLAVQPEYEVWDKVCSEAEGCLHQQCPWFKDCFFYRARRMAANANILIVNHHVLFADAARDEGEGEHAILPPFSAVVIDEAHNVEEAATSYFAERIGRHSVGKMLGRLYRHRSRKKPAGLLTFWETVIARKEKVVHGCVASLIEQTIALEKKVDEVFDSCAHFCTVAVHAATAPDGEGRTNGAADNRRPFITITAEMMQSLEYKDIIADHVRSLVCDLDRLVAELSTFDKRLAECSYKKNQHAETSRASLRSVMAKLMGCAVLMKLFIETTDDDIVRWLESSKNRKSGAIDVYFNSAPVEVKKLLQKILFERNKTVVLTSATLTVEGSMAYVKESLGFSLCASERRRAASELMLPASFNYEEQVFLGIFEDLPLPTDRSYRDAVTDTVYKTLAVTGGKAFVLFTSYAMLNACAERLREPLAHLGIRLLKQGETNRHTLLSQFKRDVTSVLFGTDSFWEGVDVEGESLSNVLITRLPFQVPDDPVVEARSERIQRQGRNPFMDYLVPQAVLKFRQGFGRLIRSRNDFGTVLIFDARIVRKHYGMKFLNSLPACTIACGSEQVILNNIVQFYRRREPMAFTNDNTPTTT